MMTSELKPTAKTQTAIRLMILMVMMAASLRTGHLLRKHFDVVITVRGYNSIIAVSL